MVSNKNSRSITGNILKTSRALLGAGAVAVGALGVGDAITSSPPNPTRPANIADVLAHGAKPGHNGELEIKFREGGEAYKVYAAIAQAEGKDPNDVSTQEGVQNDSEALSVALTGDPTGAGIEAGQSVTLSLSSPLVNQSPLEATQGFTAKYIPPSA